MGLNQWLASLPAGKRHIYFLLLGIILITIPCYCLGIAALAATQFYATHIFLKTPRIVFQQRDPAISSDALIPLPEAWNSINSYF